MRLVPWPVALAAAASGGTHAPAATACLPKAASRCFAPGTSLRLETEKPRRNRWSMRGSEECAWPSQRPDVVLDGASASRKQMKDMLRHMLDDDFPAAWPGFDESLIEVSCGGVGYSVQPSRWEGP